MRIIISPAKKMRHEGDSLPWLSLPHFIDKTQLLLNCLQSMTYDELKKLWKCNDKIAELNFERIKNMQLDSMLSPAILAYDGIQYRFMAPGVFTDTEFDYIQEHLRIISGFYGLLRPFDGVCPYRLEMQAKLKTEHGKDLYEFWKDLIALKLFEETDCVINLASKEYSVCVSRFLPKKVHFIDIVFGEEINGKIIEKGTMCKMARGEMVRFMAEKNIKHPEGIKEFNRLEYRYSPAHSDEHCFVFLKT